jgi:hypothetical protein
LGVLVSVGAATCTIYNLNEIPPDTSPIFRPNGFKQYIREIADAHRISGISSGTSGTLQDVPANAAAVSQSQRLLQRPVRTVAPAEDSRAAVLIDLLCNLATDKAESEESDKILRDRGLRVSVKQDKD